MRRGALATFALVVTLAGCKKPCAELCDRQAECVRAPEGQKEALKPVDQRDLCIAVCETRSKDATHASAMQEAIACAKASCADFVSCLGKIATK